MDENRLQNLIGVRYSIDFRYIPEAFLKHPTTILFALIRDEAAQFFADIYNDTYAGAKTVKKEDFKITQYKDEDDFIYFVTLPDGYDGDMKQCLAYGLAFVREGEDMSAQFFFIERDDGEVKMGGLDVHLDHREFGPALPTDRENALKMLMIAKRDDALNWDSQVDF